MLTTKRSIRMLAIGVVLAAVLAACGSSGSSKTDTGSSGTTGGAASGEHHRLDHGVRRGPGVPDPAAAASRASRPPTG